MTWARFDDGWSESPEIVQLSDRAYRTLHRAIEYVARHLTDGFVPGGAVHDQRSVRELSSAGLLESVDGGFHVRDWYEHVPSAEEVRQRREATAKRVRRSREARGNAVTNAVGNAAPDPTRKNDLKPLHSQRRASARRGESQEPDPPGRSVRLAEIHAAFVELCGEPPNARKAASYLSAAREVLGARGADGGPATAQDVAHAVRRWPSIRRGDPTPARIVRDWSTLMGTAEEAAR